MYDKFNDKLPKYWVVKLTKKNQQEFKDTVGKYITNVYKIPWKYCDINSYYGYDGSSSFKGTGCHATYSYFSNNPTILTLEEFKSYFEEFELPKKWCILKDKQEVCDWFNKNSSKHYSLISRNTHYIHHPAVISDYRLYSAPVEGYTEITFEQFKQYVLKPIEPEFILPELWSIKVDADNVQVLTQWVEAHDDFDKDFDNIHGWVINKNMYDRSYQFYATKTPSGYTEITFEQFKKYVLKEDNMKKIIGYKLKKDCEQYKEAAANLSAIPSYPERRGYYCVNDNSTSIENFKKAGVLDLWFEPVYEEEFKIGDWVTVTKAFPKEANIDSLVIGGVYKVEGTPYLHVKTVPLKGLYDITNCFRKATPEEIAKASVKELNFGIVKFTIKPGQDYAETEYGKVPKRDIKAAIDWVKNAPTLAGFRFTIHNTKSGKYETLEDISTGNISDTMIGFGCRYGKLNELEAIYKAFD